MKNIFAYNNLMPKISNSAFVAKTAIVTGNVEIGDDSGIWYGCVLRGDVAKLSIGKNSNIQDNSVLHGTRPNHIQNKTGKDGAQVIIGDNVTIGHSALIHACTISDNSFIGMKAVVMDLAIVEPFSMLAAGGVLTPGKVIKSGQIWAGNPAKYFRDLTDQEKDYIITSANNYAILAKEYKESEAKC